MKSKLKSSALTLTLLAAAAITNLSYAAESNIVNIQKLNWETAQKLTTEAVKVCASRGYGVTVTVVDAMGLAQSVIRGDALPQSTLTVSYRKAYTAFFYGRAFNKNSTSELIEAKLGGPDNGSLNTVPEVLFIPGGVTLRKADGTVLGGIGVSGAPGGEKDQACAQAAVDKYKADFL